MKRRSNLLAMLLVLCLSVSLVPVEALATGSEVSEISEEEEMSDEISGEPEEKELEEKEGQEEEKPEAKQAKEGETKKEVLEEKKPEEKIEEKIETTNSENEKTEVPTAPGEDDPGADRLNGRASAEFYGPMPKTRAAVTYKHNSKFNSGYTIQKGIDVSYHNGNIDWEKVKKDGVQFAIIRVAYRGYGASGSLNMDKKVYEYLKGAEAAGIPFGVYIFSQAITEKEAVQEADYIIDAIKGYKITLPVVMDYEYASDNGLCGRLYNAKLSRSKATNVCLAFMNRVKERGYTPMLYANKGMLSNDLDAAKLSGACQIWLAHYTAQTSYTGDYDYWQYSSTGKVNGISGNVDMNFRYIKNSSQAVTGFKVSGKTTNSISLKWSKFSGAAGYDIYRKNSAGKYVQIGTTTGTSYVDKSLSSGKSYTYKVRYYKEDAVDTDNGADTDDTVETTVKTYGPYSSAVTGITAIAGTKITKTTRTFNKVRVIWKKVSGVSGYKVYRYNSSKKAYSLIKTLGSSASNYVDEGLNASTTYKYKVRAYKKVGGTTVYSPYSQIVSVKTAGSVKGTVTASNVNVRSGAGTSYKSLKKVGKNTRLTITGSKGGWYRTSVTVKGKKKTGYILSKYVKLSSSGIGKPTISGKAASYNKIKLTWKKVSGASGYQIQRYSPSKKKYVTVKTITKGSTVSYTNGSLKASTTYKFRMRAYKQSGGKKTYGSWSSVKSVKTKAS